MNLIEALCEGVTIGGLSVEEILGKNPALLSQIISNSKEEAVGFIETMKEKVTLTDDEQKALDKVQEALGKANEEEEKTEDSGVDVSDITSNQQKLLDENFTVKKRGEEESKGQAKFDSIAELYLDKKGDEYVARTNLPEGITVKITNSGGVMTAVINDGEDSEEPLYTITAKKEKDMKLEDKLQNAINEGQYVISLDDGDLDKFMQATSDIEGTIMPYGQEEEEVPRCPTCGTPHCECVYPEDEYPEDEYPEDEGTKSESDRNHEGTKSESDMQSKAPAVFSLASQWID